MLGRLMLRSSTAYVLASVWSTCRAMSTSSTRRAAIAQLKSTSNKLANLLDVAWCAGRAKREGASMLLLPECFGFMGTNSQQTVAQAEPPVLEDEIRNEAMVSDALASTVQQAHEMNCGATELSSTFDFGMVGEGRNVSLLDGLKTIARESGLWISGGGMHVSGAPPSEDDESQRARVYNTHVVIDSSGKVQCLYRKIHLFDVSIPGKVNLQESATTAPGTQLVVCDSPIGTLKSCPEL